jgi:hypothetical protein
MPHLDKAFSSQSFTKYVLNSQQNFADLEHYVMEGRIDELQIRFSAWRFFMGVLSPNHDNQQKLAALK